MKTLTSEKMLLGFKQLDSLLPKKVNLIIGGGGAMLLAHQFPLATADIDAVPQGMSIDELKPLIEQVAQAIDLPGDWLNPWFASFTYVLPDDFQSRLLMVFQGTLLSAQALGKNDLLIMKCFAHRKKDIPHARKLIRDGADIQFVESHLLKLKKRETPQSKEALTFLDEILDMEDA